MNTINRSEEEIDLKEILSIIIKYKKSIIFITISSLTISIIFVYFKHNIYQANATLEIQDRKVNSSSLAGEALIMGDIGSLNLDTEMEIIKSRFLISQTINRLDMQHHYYINSKLKKVEIYNKLPFEVILEKGFDILFELRPLNMEKFYLKTKIDDKEIVGTYSFNKRIDNPFFTLKVIKKDNNDLTLNSVFFFKVDSKNTAINRIKRNLETSMLTKKSSIIKISYQDNIPLRAQKFANTLADTYIEQNIKRRILEAEKTLDFINKQLLILETNMQKSAFNIETFQKKTKTIDINKKIERLSEELSNYEMELSKLKLQENFLKNFLKKIEAKNNLESLTISGIGIEDDSLAQMISSLRESILKEKQLKRDYTDSYPEVKKIGIKIEQLKKMIEDNIKSLYKNIQERKNIILKQIKNFKNELASLPENQRVFLALQRRFSSNEKFYTYLMEKKTETEIKKASTITANRVLDYAVLPKFPIKPKRKIIVLIGLITGLIIGVTQAFLREFLNDKIITKKDIENLTNIPVIGVIPTFKDKNLEILSSPKSAYAEAFREIRTNLFFMLDNSKGSIISVTSTIPAEGKSTIAINLAKIVSISNKRVILINLDLRKPTLHKRIKISNDIGMSTLLSGHSNLEDVIQKSEYENLDVISSGPIPPNPSELIGKEIFIKILEVLKDKYDFIILDTPPIGIVTDSKLIVSQSDTILYVVRSNYSKKEFIENIKKIYKERNSKGVGIILNDFNVKGDSYGYNYGYNYGYYGD